jgi:hypothetical protein
MVRRTGNAREEKLDSAAVTVACLGEIETRIKTCWGGTAPEPPQPDN